MKKEKLLERITALTSPIKPIGFGHELRLNKISGIKCVAFDFYGTMFISGVGEISVDEEKKSSYAEYFTEALTSTGYELKGSDIGEQGLEYFDNALESHINQKKSEGIDHPEPEIRSVWNDVLISLSEDKLIEGPVDDNHVVRFAIEYEFRANTIWPVPGLNSILQNLLDSGIKLGIISNSQFYTPLAFEALIGESPTDFGFDEKLQKWSYSEAVKKPSVELYRRFRDELPDKNLKPEEILYVGNDLNKDMIPAKKLGFKTALYVGDQRSVRHDGEELSNCNHHPDLIIDNLSQISDCLES